LPEGFNKDGKDGGKVLEGEIIVLETVQVEKWQIRRCQLLLSREFGATPQKEFSTGQRPVSNGNYVLTSPIGAEPAA
jgi:hypothetical protein